MQLSRRDQRRSCAGACPEIADRQVRCGRLLLEPPGYGHQTAGQQINIETESRRSLLANFFVLRQQVDQQGCEVRIVESACHIEVARTITAAAAAMSEN